MNVTKAGTLKRHKKWNRENQKPPHERPHGMATHIEDEELFFGDTPFALAGKEE